jgi:hypothetical protein
MQCVRQYHLYHPYHMVAPGLPITWLLSHITDFFQEIRSWDQNQKVKSSHLALFSCHMHQIWGWNDIFDNVFFENTLFGPFKLKYTFYKNCCFSLSGTVHRTYRGYMRVSKSECRAGTFEHTIADATEGLALIEWTPNETGRREDSRNLTCIGDQGRAVRVFRNIPT